MAFEHKPGSGTLFNNDRKTADNQPDMTGEIKLPDGTLMRLAAWRKDGTKGPFYSLKLSEITKAAPAAKPAPAEETGPRPNDPDDDLGF
jgi:hypothetical protein